MVRFYGLLLCVLTFAHLSWAQTDLSKGYSLEYLGMEQGLPNYHAEAVTQDQQGVLWLASYGTGVLRYDGNNFKTFSQSPDSRPRLRHNNVKDVLIDKQGRLWVGHLLGIDIINPKDLTVLHQLEMRRIPNGAKGYTQRMMMDKNGDIWVAVNNNGIAFFPGGDVSKLQWYEEIPELVYVNRTPDGQLFALSNKSGFHHYENGGFKPCFPQLNALNPDVPFIKPIENSTGQLVGFWWVYIGGKSDGYQYQSDSQSFIPGLPPDGITVKTDKRIQEVMLKMDSPYNRHAIYRHALRCFTDQQGIIWIATQFGGFFKLKPRELSFMTCPELNGVSLRGMIEDPDGQIYIGSYSGLFRYNPALNRAVHISNHSQIIVFKPAWIQGDSLFTFSETQSAVKLHLAKPWIYRKAQGLHPENEHTTFAGLQLDSSTFLAGNRVLFKIDKHSLNISAFATLPVTPETKVFSFKNARDGHIWVGTSEGIFKISRNGILQPVDFLRKHFCLGNESRINDVYETKDGSIWFATNQHGLIYYDSASGAITIWNIKSGLPSNEVYAIIIPDDGPVLWVSTSAGLCALDISQKRLHCFGEADGTAGDEFNTGSFLQARDGTLYFGGVKGLTRFSPGEFKPEKLSLPTPYISSMAIEDIYSDEITYIQYPSLDSLLKLKNSQNTLELFLGSTDYFRPQNNTYLTKLEPIDADWVWMGKQRSIKYYRLPAGNYTLRIKLNNLNSREYTIQFQIDQIWYLKTWFLTMVCLALLTLIAGIWVLRRSRQLREEKIRRAIAHELHNALGGKISTLGQLLHIIRKQLESGNSVVHELDRSDALIKRAASTLSDVIWVLSKNLDSNMDLIQRMMDYSDKWLKAAHIQVVFEHEQEAGLPNLPLPIQYECLLLFKELLGNILKHTISDLVVIQFTYKREEGVTLKVKNHYIKKMENVVSGGQGLKIVREHVEKLGGNFEVLEAENTFEAKIRLIVPFKKR